MKPQSLAANCDMAMVLGSWDHSLFQERDAALVRPEVISKQLPPRSSKRQRFTAQARQIHIDDLSINRSESETASVLSNTKIMKASWPNREIEFQT